MKVRELVNNSKVRAYFYQFIILLLIVLVLYEIVNNAIVNVRQLGVESGFDFMSRNTGFGIIQSLIDYDETSSYFRSYFVGLLNTILVAIVGIFFATILGFIIGIARLSKNFLVRMLSSAYVEVFRNIPLLLQIFFWYSAVLVPLPSPKSIYEKGDVLVFALNNRGIYLPNPQFNDNIIYFFISIFLAFVCIYFFRRYARRRQDQEGIQFPVFFISTGLLFILPTITYVVTALFTQGSLTTFEYAQMGNFRLSGGIKIIPEFIALLLALSIYTAAFIAEIVRSGIQAVSYGQTEASLSLGLKRNKILQLIIIPQALRIIIPPLTSQYLNLTKNSSLATAIAYPDLVSVFAGTVLNQTGQAIEILSLTMLTYLTISLVTSFFMNIYNKKMALVER